MPPPAAIPDAKAHIIDTRGFGMDRYCGVFALPGDDGVALVETGPSSTVDAVLDGLDQLGLGPDDITHILPTHIHLDHGGALWRLLELCPQATAYVHSVGLPYLIDQEKVDKLLVSVKRAVGETRFPQYGTFEAIDPERVVEVTGGEKITAAGRTLELLDAPGHAPHQYVVHDPAHSTVYAGDALGIKTPDGPLLQTSPPPAFDLQAWHGTLDTLAALDVDQVALTHYGWVDADDHIARFRAQLDAWVDEIRRFHEAGADLDTTIEHLAEEHTEGLIVYDEEIWYEELKMNTAGVWLWLERQG